MSETEKRVIIIDVFVGKLVSGITLPSDDGMGYLQHSVGAG